MESSPKNQTAQEVENKQKTPEDVAAQVGRITAKLMDRANRGFDKGVKMNRLSEVTGNEVKIAPNGLGQTIELTSEDGKYEKVSTELSAGSSSIVTTGTVKSVPKKGSISVHGKMSRADYENQHIDNAPVLSTSLRGPNDLVMTKGLNLDQSISAAASTLASVRGEFALREQAHSQQVDESIQDIISA